ncbi:epididymal secretory glutathione peroxidase-like, partial [Saccoglossus kowalevskii]
LTHQYLELNALVDEFRDYNFTVLGFPVNQFGHQEPGANKEILSGLREVRPGRGYVPNFDLFEKGDVNGFNQQPVWKYLKHWNPFNSNDIRWTFKERFIVDATGTPYIRINDYTDIYTHGGLRDDIYNFLHYGHISL